MMKSRCKWVNPESKIYIDYHDKEWGVPVYDDQLLFEYLTLEGAQAGLSWLTILKKRDGYRSLFEAFDIRKVAAFDEQKIKALKNNPAIIRNELKIRSTVSNAKAILNIQKEEGSFSQFLWSYVNHQPIVNSWSTISNVPASTELSDSISKDLKKKGFKFTGSTIVYAFMQAVGMVNDHTTDCFRYTTIRGKS